MGGINLIPSPAFGIVDPDADSDAPQMQVVLVSSDREIGPFTEYWGRCGSLFLFVPFLI